MPKPERPPPEIGGLQKPLGNSNVVAGKRLANLGAVIGNHRLSAFHEEIARATRFALVDHGDTVAHGQRLHGGEFEVRPGIDEGARCDDDMGQAAHDGGHRIIGDIADIIVEIRLHPGPARAGIEDAHGLAEQKFRIRAAFQFGTCPHLDDGNADDPRSAGDIIGRLDDAAQAFFGKVGAIGVQPAVWKIKHGVSDRQFASLINDQVAKFFKIKRAIDRALDDHIASCRARRGCGRRGPDRPSCPARG